jgi:hypothetical protein
MNKSRLIFAALVLGLSACAESSHPVIQSRLADLKGKPVATLVAKLGDPDSKEMAGDDQVYVWNGSSKSFPNFWTNFSDCSLKAYVDKDGNITGFFHSGTNAVCDAYAHALDSRF